MSKQDAIVQILSDSTGFSARYIRAVRDGERNNDGLFDRYMVIQDGMKKLVQEAEKLVPLPTKKTHRKPKNRHFHENC